MNGKAGWNLGWPSVNNLGRWTINWQTPTAGAGKHEFVGGVRKATVVLFGVLFGVFILHHVHHLDQKPGVLVFNLCICHTGDSAKLSMCYRCSSLAF